MGFYVPKSLPKTSLLGAPRSAARGSRRPWWPRWPWHRRSPAERPSSWAGTAPGAEAENARGERKGVECGADDFFFVLVFEGVGVQIDL